jgi:ABC-2 type transport system permease protein
MTKVEHRAFSVDRIAAIATNTVADLTRQKVFLVLLIFAILLIGGSVFLTRFSFQQEFQIVKDVSLGAMSIFTSLLAIVATARLIPQDTEDRTVYTILAKPVPRWEYLLGKLFGVLALLAISLAIMTALFVAVLYTREQTILHETARQMKNAPHEQLNDALNQIRASGLHIELFLGIGVIFFKACLLAALTLFVSTFATTHTFTVMVMVAVYFIGHLESTAREYWLTQQGTGWIASVFLAIVALLCPDLQAFNAVDEIIAGSAFSLALFVKTGLLGVFYVMIYTLAAIFAFDGKEL